MTTPAGDRDTYLTLWRNSATVPGSTAATGQMVETATKVGYVWGKISSAMPPVNAAGIKGQNENWASYHVNVDARYVITVPYGGIDPQPDDWFTAHFRGVDYRYDIAGQPIYDGGDLHIPANQTVV